MKPTKALAKKIAAKIGASYSDLDWDEFRNMVASHTDELDCFQLDMLTDWVIEEVPSAGVQQ